MHLLCRISTFEFMYFINCYTTWSFSSWLKQVMVIWVQPRHQGSLSIPCTFVHSCSCKGFLFPLLANAWLLSSLTFSGFNYLHLLNARLRDSLVFSIFSDILLAELCFAYFSTHYSFSFLSCLPSYQCSLSVLLFTYFPFFHHCLWLYTDLSLTVLLYCFDLHCLPLPFH